jgi:hypothetical protein
MRTVSAFDHLGCTIDIPYQDIIVYPYKKAKLLAPRSYVNALPEVRLAVSNGCGTEGWKGKLVPDTIWFLNITEICHIHDWMYAIGETQEEKDEADRIFLANLDALIDSGSILLRFPRRHRAYKYYLAVAIAGEKAYWHNKTRNIKN